MHQRSVREVYDESDAVVPVGVPPLAILGLAQLVLLAAIAFGIS
jgi:hypothetical protein